MNLKDIVFPVYYLGRNEPMQDSGLSFYIYVVDEDSSAPKLTYKMLDDKNIDKNSLSLRRLDMLKNGASLYKLSRAIFFIGDLLKMTKGPTWYIDSSGTIFEYKKTKRVPLIFKKVSKILPMPKGGAVIEAEGIPYRFKSLFVPKLEQKWVGLLKINHGYILYGLYNKLLKNTHRLI